MAAQNAAGLDMKSKSGHEFGGVVENVLGIGAGTWRKLTRIQYASILAMIIGNSR